MEIAREKIIEDGFQFVKGKSRSKKDSIESDVPKPKRQKLSKEIRESRLKEVKDTIKDYDERIQFKEKRVTACINVCDYKTCDELKGSIMELKKKRYELESEKKHLEVSSRQSRWYHKKRSSHSSQLSSSESDNRLLCTFSPPGVQIDLTASNDDQPPPSGDASASVSSPQSSENVCSDPEETSDTDLESLF